MHGFLASDNLLLRFRFFKYGSRRSETMVTTLLEVRVIAKSNPKSRRITIQKSWKDIEKANRKAIAVAKQGLLLSMLESNSVGKK
jgi:hypothetical protein